MIAKYYLQHLWAFLLIIAFAIILKHKHQSHVHKDTSASHFACACLKHEACTKPTSAWCGVWRVKLSSLVELVLSYTFPLGNRLLQIAEGVLGEVWVSCFMLIIWNAAYSIWLTLPFYAFLDGLLKIIYGKPWLVSGWRHSCFYRKMDTRLQHWTEIYLM